ncbi:MAG: sigma-70 family RNA polymerase sigma factor [Deltaproteobacteria bacterium]
MNYEKGVATMNPDRAESRSEHSSEERDLKLLLAQISLGNEEAMRKFYKKTVRLVYGMSHRIIFNAEEAEEVALEVFMYIWKNASQYDPELSQPLSWLLMITRSRSIDKIRKNARTVSINEHIDENMIKGKGTPEDSCIAGEKRMLVRGAISQLTPKQKEVIELSYYHQFSHSEIAERVGIPVGSVKSTIRVAMVKLKNIIKNAGVESEHVTKIH